MSDVTEPGDDASTSDTRSRLGERASVGRNIAQAMSSQVFTWALSMVVLVLVPRLLGSELVGELRYAQGLWAIAGVVMSLGTSHYIQLEIARRRASGLAQVGPILMMRTVGFTFCALMLAGLVAVGDRDAQFTVVMAAIGGVALFNTWSDLFGTVFVGLERVSTKAVADVLGRAVNAIGVVTLVLVGGGLYGVLAAGTLAIGAKLAFLTRRVQRLGIIRFSGWRSRVLPILRMSASYLLLSSSIVLYAQVDTIMLASLATPEELGWYATAEVLTGSLLFPATIVMATILPTLGRLFVEDTEQFHRLVARVVSILSLASIPVALGTMVVGPTFAPFIYGDEFAGTGQVLVALGPMIALSYGTIMFGSLAMATDRTRLWVVVMLSMTALTVPLDAVLVPWAQDRFDNGAIGGAVSFMVTEVTQCVVGVVLLAPFLLTSHMAWRMLRILVAGAAMVTATWPLRDLFVIVPAIVGAIVYGIAVFGLRVVGDDERELIRRLRRRLRS